MESRARTDEVQQPAEVSPRNISSHGDGQAEPTEQEEAPCGPRQYGSKADLCAQWKAADAAADSAWWAWMGGLIGIGSLVGVLAALALALHSNWIARDTARHQLRAYVTYDRIELVGSGLMGRSWMLESKWRNTGQTPALNVYILTNLAILDVEQEFDGATEAASKSILGPLTIAPGEPASGSHVVISERDLHAVARGRRGIVWGKVVYEDIFADTIRETAFTVSLATDIREAREEWWGDPYGDGIRMRDWRYPWWRKVLDRWGIVQKHQQPNDDR